MKLVTRRPRNTSMVVASAIFVVSGIIGGLSLLQTRANAAPVVGFEAGKIIDDGVFTNSLSMNPAQIQNFLNSKVPTCDTYGTQPSEYGGGTRAQWGAAHYGQSTFTCLKDFSEGGKSSAQIIYDAAQEFQINPQVLIVLLQKEQGLVTDTWPLNVQYRTATGYGCPDTAPCDSQYYGLTNQVRWSARMFRAIMNNSPTWYTPYVLGNNFIRYNPQSSCGGSTVYIQNRSTQALYNYTPYQPNASALNAGYGTGDSCGAYGNRNFYLYFTDWFGSTKVNDPYGWEVIRTESNSAEYLKVGNTKRWIPSGAIFSDWNLGTKSVRVISQSDMDSIPTIPPLDRLGYYDGKYFYVTGGKKYWLSNDELLKAYGQINNKAIAAPAYIPLSTIPNGGEATFYVSSPSDNKVARIMNGQLYVINNTDADRWQANPVVISSANFSALPVAGTTDYKVSIDGKKYLVDNGTLLDISSSGLLRDFGQTNATFLAVPSELSRYLPIKPTSALIKASNDSGYYVLRGGVRYYVPTGAHAAAWGLPTSPTVISSRLASAFSTNSLALPVIVNDSQTNKTYILDGSRHELTGAMADSMEATGVSLPDFTTDYITGVPEGSTISSPILEIAGQGHLYTIISGQLYHIPTGDVLNALGYPSRFGKASINSRFIEALNSTVKSANMFITKDGVTYFQQDGYVFPIEESSKADWLNGKTPIAYNGSGFGTTRFFSSGVTPLTQFVQEGSQKYIVSAGTAYNATDEQQSVLPSGASWSQVAIFGMKRDDFRLFFAKDSTGASPTNWLITNGTKQQTNSADIRQSYKGTTVNSLSPAILAKYTQVNNGNEPSMLVSTAGKGIKLLDASGRFYEFPNSDTLINFASGKTVLSVSADLYNSLSESRGSVSRLVRDPAGKVYWIENGQRRWITNGSAYQRYAANALVNVDWVTVNFYGDGAAIN